MSNHTKATVMVVVFLVVAGFFFSPAIPTKQMRVAQVPKEHVVATKQNLLEELSSSVEHSKKNTALASPQIKRSQASKETLFNMYRMISASNRMNRFQAAKFLAEQGDQEAIPYLIRALSDDAVAIGMRDEDNPGSLTVRYWANAGLQRITGRDFGFLWNAAQDKRERAILDWRMWYMKKNSSNSAPQVSKIETAQQDMIGRFGD